MKTLRWMIVLAALGAVAYLAVAVDFGGRTLLDRITGDGEPSVTPTAPAAPDRDRRDQPTTAGQQPVPVKASDSLTDEDRAGLTKLIERLDEDPKADGGSQPAKAP